MLVIILSSVVVIGTLLMFSVLSMSVPWFRRHYDLEKWEKETPIQRFCRTFIPGFIGYLIVLILYASEYL